MSHIEAIHLPGTAPPAMESAIAVAVLEQAIADALARGRRHDRRRSEAIQWICAAPESFRAWCAIAGMDWRQVQRCAAGKIRMAHGVRR